MPTFDKNVLYQSILSTYLDMRNCSLNGEGLRERGSEYEVVLHSHNVMSDGYRRETVYYSRLKAERLSVKSNIFAEYQ